MPPPAQRLAQTQVQQRLAAGIRDIPDYPQAGVVFKDITPLLADAQLMAEAVEVLAGRLSLDGATPGDSMFGPIDVVAGIEARGFILAAPVALVLGAGFVPIRKKGKLPFTTAGTSYQLEYGAAEIEVHTDAIAAGQRVLLVDDVLATGGTAAAAVRLLTGLGAEVAGLSILIELGFLHGREQLPQLPLHSVLSY